MRKPAYGYYREKRLTEVPQTPAGFTLRISRWAMTPPFEGRIGRLDLDTLPRQAVDMGLLLHG